MLSHIMSHKKIDMFYRHISIVYKTLTPTKLFNFFKCSKSFLLKESNVNGYPCFLKIEPTSFCNLRCFGCRSGKLQDLVELPLGNMRFEVFKKICNDLGKYLFEISFYLWGEPLSNKNLPKMISYASDYNISSVISTNLHFMNNRIASDLINAGLDRMIVAIDGMRQETYSSVRIGGHFDKVISNLEEFMATRSRLHSITPTVEWQFVRTSINQHEVCFAKERARELGVDYFTVIPDWGKRSPNEHVLARARSKERKSRMKGCFWLWFAMAIQWDGAVYPCCHSAKKDHFRFSAHPSTSYLKTWNGEYYQSARSIFSKRYLEKKHDELETVCHKCPML